MNGFRSATLIASLTWLALCCGYLPSSTALAHPRHVSVAEAEWNAKTSRLEVALLVNPIDLEQALRGAAHRPVDLDKSTGIDRLLQDYLSRTFVVREADGTQPKLIWVGHEFDLKDAWLYFEVPLEAGPDNVTYGAGLFFELLPDQVNTINFRVGNAKQSLSFTVDQFEAVFRATTKD